MFCLRANFSADGIRRRLREVLPKGLFPTGAGDISSALWGRTLVFRNSRDVLLKSKKLFAAHKPPSDALFTGVPFALYGNESNHTKPHNITQNRTHCARFAEARKGEIRLRGRKDLCCLDKDWICLRFSGLSTGHLFPIFIKIKHFARNWLSWGCSIFRSINLAPELLQWCINIIKYALKYQGIGIPRSFFLSWRKILLI